ncbi:MAG: ribonuclease PH [Acidobacteria bacterium]|nr:ribonuclease PH [Acidobacteriota bacterium]
MPRPDGRSPDQLRPATITTGVIKSAEGSALIRAGETHVICTASVEDKVPPFLKDKGQGWVTAEYAMIPRATRERTQREATRGKQSGRTLEIQRLVGRALRAVVDMTSFGERTIWIDCDVIQADGGTRCASITGAYVALAQALAWVRHKYVVTRPPLTGMVAAVSVGLLNGEPLLDLNYDEDSKADVDMNVIRTNSGRYVEVQGTAEKTPFSRDDLTRLLAFADAGTDHLFSVQREALGDALTPLLRAAPPAPPNTR